MLSHDLQQYLIDTDRKGGREIIANFLKLIEVLLNLLDHIITASFIFKQFKGNPNLFSVGLLSGKLC